MRSSKGIRAVVCALVLGGILALSFFMSWLLFPYLEMRHTVHVMEEPDYDTLIVGTSHGKAGIDPDVLESVSGLKAINACLGNERMVDSYYLIRYASQNTDLKCVILEVDPSYWVIPLQITPDSLRVYHEIPWGILKTQYAADKLFHEDYRSVLFEWYLYRNEIFHVGELWKDKQSEAYKNYDISRFATDIQVYRENGFMAITRPDDPEEKTDEPIKFERKNVQKDALAMLDRIQKFCDSRGIRLITVTTPIPETTYQKGMPDTADGEKYMKDCMEERGISYFDYTQAKREGISLDIDDFNDNDGHMYADTAADFTAVFAEDLISEVEFS